MNDAQREPTISLVLSGWEPHNVVWWTRYVVGAGFARPAARVVGREPVTSTAVYIDGTISEDRHLSYDRGFTLHSRAGDDFKVGGTNTTSSIAAIFTVLQVPAQLLPDYSRRQEDLQDLIRAISMATDPSESSALLIRMEFWLRVHKISALLDRTLLSYMPQARQYLLEAIWQGSAEQTIDIDEDLDSVVDACGAVIDSRPEMASQATRVLSLIGTERCMQLLVENCGSSDARIASSSALALRAFEFEFQACQLASPILARSLLEELARVLRESTDPETRVYLAEDLGYLNPNPSLVSSALSEALQNDEVMEVKWASAVALGRVLAPVSVVSALVAEIESPSCHVRVKRAALVSLGRLLRRASLDLTGADLSGIDRPWLLKAIESCLNDEDSVVVAYALFAFGEMPEAAPSTIEHVTKLLDINASYVTVAHAVLALYKQEVRGNLAESARTVIVDVVPKLMSMSFDKGHPGSSYHEWFVLTCWRLLSRLEEPESAARFAREASRILSAQPSRSQYFQALADLQQGEHMLASHNASAAPALQLMGSALRAFQAVAARVPFAEGALSDVSTMSAVTRATWVRSRVDFVTCLDQLERMAFDPAAETSQLSLTLATVREQIDAILISRPANNVEVGPVLPMPSSRSASTEALLNWFRDATFLTDELIALRRELADDESRERLSRRHARLRTLINRMRSKSEFAVSRELDKTQVGLNSIAAQWLSDERQGDLFEPSTTAFSLLASLLRGPLPVPDIEHQLVGRGRASFTIYTREAGLSRFRVEAPDEIELVSGEAIGFRVVVRVDLLSDDEVLVLSWTSPNGAQSGRHVVTIHEGLQTIEIPLSDVEEGEGLELSVTLSLITAGYSELIAHRVISAAWTSPQDSVGQVGIGQLKRLVDERESIRRDLALYDSVGGASPERRRDREVELDRIRHIVQTLTAKMVESGLSLEIPLVRAPLRQKNGYVLAVAPGDEHLIAIAIEIEEASSSKAVERYEIIERGRIIELLVGPETYEAIVHHLRNEATDGP